MADVEVGPSKIEGLGVFAAAAYSAGQRIRPINVLREVTASTPLRPELGERVDHCDYPDNRTVLLGPPDCYVNHSCDPNAYVLYEADNPFLVARRKIPVGEEITVDYRLNVAGGDSWPCYCGAERCLGQVTGDFFQLPRALQVEYRPLLAEWFVKANRARLLRSGQESVNGG